MMLRKRIIPILLALSVAMAAYGISTGQPSAVSSKASSVCTECIGLE